MFSGQEIADVIGQLGFTHVVWLPDSTLGLWERALESAQQFRLIPACRRGAGGAPREEAKPQLAAPLANGLGAQRAGVVRVVVWGEEEAGAKLFWPVGSHRK